MVAVLEKRKSLPLVASIAKGGHGDKKESAYQVGKQLQLAASREESPFTYSGSGVAWERNGKKGVAYFLYPSRPGSEVNEVVEKVADMVGEMEPVSNVHVRYGTDADEKNDFVLPVPACVVGEIVCEGSPRISLKRVGSIRGALRRGGPFELGIQLRSQQTRQSLEVYVCASEPAARDMFGEYYGGNIDYYSAVRQRKAS